MGLTSLSPLNMPPATQHAEPSMKKRLARFAAGPCFPLRPAFAGRPLGRTWGAAAGCLLWFGNGALASDPAPGTVLWSVALGADHASPAIGSDGTIYHCSHRTLYALSPAGTTNWTFPANDICYSSPAVGRDGTIYFGSSDDHLYAVNPDGTKQWAFTAGDAILSSPALARDGTIYFGSRDRKFYALNPDGTKRWEYPAGDIQLSSPAIAGDGTIYIGTMTHMLLALRPDGTKLWEFDAGLPIDSSPALSADGTIYFTAGFSQGYGQILFAVSPEGSERWRNDSGALSCSPVLGAGGTIYVDNYVSGGISAVNPTNGTVLWTSGGPGTFRAYVASPPVVADNGLVYTGSWSVYMANLFRAMNPDGTTNWTVYGGTSTGAPTIGPDGRVYFATLSHFVAVQGDAPLAPSPWPKFHQNLRNTGKVERPELRHPQLTGDGFRCDLFGEIGQSYTLEVSTDLHRWTPLANSRFSIMPVPFFDPAVPNWDSRFYRVVSP